MSKIFLLVDDDEEDCELFREALRDVDGDAIFYCVHNGKDAFDLLLTIEKPGVIFLDINMPIMDGWECLGKLKSNKNYIDIPVIMYASSSQQNEDNTAIAGGAIRFIEKPNDFNDLRRTLREVIDAL